jgi:hypothetical protein
MQCPAIGHFIFDRVDSLGRLRACLSPLFRVASLPIQANSIPRPSRDFYFPFPKNHAGNAARPAALTLLSRSFP